MQYLATTKFIILSIVHQTISNVHTYKKNYNFPVSHRSSFCLNLIIG